MRKQCKGGVLQKGREGRRCLRVGEEKDVKEGGRSGDREDSDG